MEIWSQLYDSKIHAFFTVRCCFIFTPQDRWAAHTMEIIAAPFPLIPIVPVSKLCCIFTFFLDFTSTRPIGPILPHLSQQIHSTCRKLSWQVSMLPSAQQVALFPCYCDDVHTHPATRGCCATRRSVTAESAVHSSSLQLGPEPWSDLSVFSSPAWDPTVPSPRVSIQPELLC